MATLISGQVTYDDNNQPSGIAVTWRIKHQEYPLFLPQEDIEGLTTQEIIALAQTRADALAANHIPGNPYLFNRRYEGISNLDDLPGWAGWTGAEAADFVRNDVLSGMTKVQIEAWVDANVTDLPSAKNALKLLGGEIVDLRNIAEKMAQAIMYLRDMSTR